MSRSCCSPSWSASSQAARRLSALGVGVGEGDLEQRSLAGEGGPQFVRGVGHEVALGLEGRFEPPEEVVEGPAEFGELVVGTVEAEASMQVGGGDLLGGGGDRAQRSQEPTGEPPGERRPRSTAATNDDERGADVELADRAVLGAGDDAGKPRVGGSNLLPYKEAGGAEHRGDKRDERVPSRAG